MTDTRTILPKHVQDLMWEYAPDQIQWPVQREVIILKVLEYGNWESVQWLIQTAGVPAIREWMIRNHGRALSVRQLRFWQNILDIPSGTVDVWVSAARQNTWENRLHR